MIERAEHMYFFILTLKDCKMFFYISFARAGIPCKDVDIFKNPEMIACFKRGKKVSCKVTRNCLCRVICFGGWVMEVVVIHINNLAYRSFTEHSEHFQGCLSNLVEAFLGFL